VFSLADGYKNRNETADAGSVFGKVYTSRELAELWQLSENTIRRLFQDENGVFTLDNANKGKRGYSTLRIPETTALRVWRKHGGGAA
jgi:hypothetical protein